MLAMKKPTLLNASKALTYIEFFLQTIVNSLNFCFFMDKSVKAFIYFLQNYLIWQISRKKIKAIAGAVGTGAALS
jgi:hypothetical protein